MGRPERDRTAEQLRREFSHVTWLGGSPCAGKSTIADLLGEMFDLGVFHVDELAGARWSSITQAGQPTMWRLLHYDCDQLWMRDVSEQVRGAVAFYAEEFALIVEEIGRLPRDLPLLVEGASLLPTSVTPYLGQPPKAVWLVPTEAAQRAWYAQRNWTHEVLRDCTDKAKAFDRWMARDAGFAVWVRLEAERRGQRVFVVDGKLDLEEVAARVAGLLNLA